MVRFSFVFIKSVYAFLDVEQRFFTAKRTKNTEKFDKFLCVLSVFRDKRFDQVMQS